MKKFKTKVMSKLKTMIWKLFGYADPPAWHNTDERKAIEQKAKTDNFQKLVLYIYDELVDQDTNWHNHIENKYNPTASKNSPEWALIRTELIMDIVNHERKENRMPPFTFTELHEKITQHKFHGLVDIANKAAHIILS